VLAGCSSSDSKPKRLSSKSVSTRRPPACTRLPDPSAQKDYVFPLKVSGNGRYLVDQENRPFRIQGDSAQSLIANLTISEAETYLSDRKAKGFNSINMNLLEHKFAIKAPANRRGDAPFKTPEDFSKPNEAYFAFADSILDLAASKGMLVSLAVMYLGYAGGEEGWWQALNKPSNSQAVCFQFGKFIGHRYKNRRNILWVIGGDYMPPADSEGEKRLHSFMEGIKAANVDLDRKVLADIAATDATAFTELVKVAQGALKTKQSKTATA